jgi:hypothetical protein
MGVDNVTNVADGAVGRKSLNVQSKDSFYQGLLIGDFAHVPGSDCGTWPAL